MKTYTAKERQKAREWQLVKENWLVFLIVGGLWIACTAQVINYLNV